MNLMEKNLNFVAITAVEDKLQDRVADTIVTLKDAGMDFWVLTGMLILIFFCFENIQKRR